MNLSIVCGVHPMQLKSKPGVFPLTGSFCVVIPSVASVGGKVSLEIPMFCFDNYSGSEHSFSEPSVNIVG